MYICILHKEKFLQYVQTSKQKSLIYINACLHHPAYFGMHDLNVTTSKCMFLWPRYFNNKINQLETAKDNKHRQVKIISSAKFELKLHTQ